MSRLPGRRNREEAFHNLEIARQQRLLPVQCWEKAWVTPEGALPGSTFKVLKWVKADKKQEFSDDEMETNERQLAAVRDEMEALAGAADQEVEELEAADQDGEEREGGESRADSPGGGTDAGIPKKKAPLIALNPASPSAMDMEPSSSVDPAGITPSPAPTTEPTTPGNTMDI